MAEGATNKKKRRKFLKTAGVGAGILMAGCLSNQSGETSGGTSGETSGGTSGGQQSSLRFWSKETESQRVNTINELANSFDSTSVETNFVAEQEMPKELSSARTTGNLPHVYQATASTQTKLYHDEFADIEANTAVLNEIGEDRFVNNALEFVRESEDGKYYAIPHNAFVLMVWYRNDWFEEEGLKPPSTWDRILKAAKTFNDQDNNKYGISLGTDKSIYTRVTFTPFAKANEAEVFNQKGEVIFDSEKMIESLDFYGNKLGEYTPPSKQSWTGARKTYESGQSSMTVWPSYMMDTIIDAGLVEQSSMQPFIKKERESTFGRVLGLQITKATGNKDSKKKLANYFIGSDPWEPYIKWLHLAPGGMQPLVKETYSRDDWKDNDLYNEWGSEAFDTVRQAADNIQSFGTIGGSTIAAYGPIKSRLLITEAVVRVIENEDPEAVAKDVAEKMREFV